MLEQFRRWFNNLNNCYTTDTEQRMQALAWKDCCKWVLEKAGENINLIDFMNDIASEAGVRVVTTAEDLNTSENLQDGRHEELKKIKEKSTDYIEKVENEAKDCIHNMECTRGCKFIGDGCGPVWKKSAGWTPCKDYEQDSEKIKCKTHHCKHADFHGVKPF